MNYIIISTEEYPDQHAAAIRNTTMAQGIVEDGHNVKFILLSPQEWNCTEINYKGVEFKTLCEYRGKNKIIKGFDFFYALFKLQKVIKQNHIASPVDAIIIYAIDNFIIYLTLNICRNKRIRIFHERTELPILIGETDTIIGKIRYYFYLHNLIPRFDGLFVITDKLQNFFSTYNNKIKKILTIVDTDFFIVKPNPVYHFPYIAYCGTMSGDKDGVPILIRSFAKLTKHFPNHKLLLIGNSSDKVTFTSICRIIDELEIQEKVVFTGFVKRVEMPHLLGNADLLVVSKPDNEQNSANFPIKIGEYLSTGVPIVVTKVGEIAKFITDGENGFIASPNCVESFYSKMNEALSDYSRAKKIGLNGRILAQQVFDYKIQSKIMTDFIKEIINK